MGRLLETYRKVFKTSKSNPDPKEPTPLEEMGYLYTVLGVLDSKASALMRFDAILIAVSSLMLSDRSFDLSKNVASPLIRPVLLVILLLSLAAEWKMHPMA